MSNPVRVFTFSMVLLSLFASAGAATLDLTCSRDRLLEGSPATGLFSVQIQSSHGQVTSIKHSLGGWCDVRDGQVTEQEISFPCAFELAGQRVSFSFTLNKLTGFFEQRFFVGGKLQQIHHGSCTLNPLSNQ
jgi:hypothetical protein